MMSRYISLLRKEEHLLSSNGMEINTKRYYQKDTSHGEILINLLPISEKDKTEELIAF